RPPRLRASGFIASELRRTCRAKQRTARRSGAAWRSPPMANRRTIRMDRVPPPPGGEAVKRRPERAPPLAVFTELNAVAPVFSADSWAAGRMWNGPGPHTLVLHSDDSDGASYLASDAGRSSPGCLLHWGDLSCISHGRPWRTGNWVQVSVLADRETACRVNASRARGALALPRAAPYDAAVPRPPAPTCPSFSPACNRPSRTATRSTPS